MILVVDFGSQFTQLVARRIRELSVFSEIVSFLNAPEKIQQLKKQKRLSGVIFSGGPYGVYDEHAPQINLDLEKLNVPLLGICYGLQLINVMLGGKVAPAKQREYGFEKIILEKNIVPTNPLYSLNSKKKDHKVWMSHGDHIQKLAPQLSVSSYTRNGIIASFHHKTLPIFGVQFHPEVEQTTCGKDLLKYFTQNICENVEHWDASIQVESAIQFIQNAANQNNKNSTVICALSGGVDSCVAAVLAQKALGERLLCLFINNGFLRKKEYETVLQTFQTELHLNVKGIDASELFLFRLAGISDPEEKRKIIGKTFIDVFESETQNTFNTEFLIQGTLYPDVIESLPVHGTSATIKTHHNVGGLPKKMKLKLIEPLRNLFKDEVRKLGAQLAIPAHILARHPFPGPGLSIRIIGEVTKQRLEILREADSIFIDELQAHGLYDLTWQAFVVLLPVSSVGVMGDARTYENVAALRCVNSTDGMTSDWSRLPYEFLAKVSSRITNEVRGINRIVYDISSKPPATIEWE
jgi:GMP synthase (glutamine-hydrolysing)